jgi:hypothetical protein
MKIDRSARNGQKPLVLLLLFSLCCAFSFQRQSPKVYYADVSLKSEEFDDALRAIPFDAKAWCATHAVMPNGAFCTSSYAGLDKELAIALLPILNGTVGDFGAGGGWYSSFFQNHSIESTPYDASPTRPASVHFADLTAPLDASVPAYDWVLCLEVGEHLPTESENVFIDNVAGHAKLGIVMSWAVPGQRGNGHVNNRPNDWVVEQLRSRAFTYDKDASELLRGKATFKWFKNTLMVFRSGGINEAPKKSSGPYRILY